MSRGCCLRDNLEKRDPRVPPALTVPLATPDRVENPERGARQAVQGCLGRTGCLVHPAP